MRLGIGSYTYTWAVGVPGHAPPSPLSAADLVKKANAAGLHCAQIADNAPLTLRVAKHTIDAMSAEPESFDRDAIEVMTKACFDSADYTEGRTAFMEKRKPTFVGR